MLVGQKEQLSRGDDPNILETHGYISEGTGNDFTKGLWVHELNLMKIIIAVIMMLVIQLDHKFAHVTTAVLSWHMQNCDLIGSSLFR